MSKNGTLTVDQMKVALRESQSSDPSRFFELLTEGANKTFKESGDEKTRTSEITNLYYLRRCLTTGLNAKELMREDFPERLRSFLADGVNIDELSDSLIERLYITLSLENYKRTIADNEATLSSLIDSLSEDERSSFTSSFPKLVEDTQRKALKHLPEGNIEVMLTVSDSLDIPKSLFVGGIFDAIGSGVADRIKDLV